MKLKTLHIYESYDDAQPLKGSIEFASPLGEIKINIKPEHMQPILEIVADALVASTKEAAGLLTSQIISSAADSRLLK